MTTTRERKITTTPSTLMKFPAVMMMMMITTTTIIVTAGRPEGREREQRVEEEKRKGTRATSKERKTGKSSGEEAAGQVELAELREMMHDLMLMQKATAGGKKEGAGRSEEDVIALDTFAVGGGYGRYPYGQPNISHPTTRSSENYLNRRNEPLQPRSYRQDCRGGY